MIYFNTKKEVTEFLDSLKSAGIRCGITKRDGRYLLQIR
jgi:hypothetical protein